jgi:LacI family transcriptional regulator
MEENHRVCLLFNANKGYDRQIIVGIGEYLQLSHCKWELLIEEDFTSNLNRLSVGDVDGVIADFDNPENERFLDGLDAPVVGVGSSYENEEDYPASPYVGTDNRKIIEMAVNHLKSKGLERFAFYGIAPTPCNRWSQEREKAFISLMRDYGYQSNVFRGGSIIPVCWNHDMYRLSDWLQTLPKPIGIVAVTDSRARLLIQACEKLNILIPDQVSLIGIDNDELVNSLTSISLSSVGQGCKEMGYRAAKTLHNIIKSGQNTKTRKPVLVGPSRIYERQSTDYISTHDPHVIQALHYIRQRACTGIKVEQVLDFVGISRSNLETRFKKELNHSIHHQIYNAKLAKAKTLLQTTDLKISEISSVCGYPSLQYMYAVFKKALNTTPKEHRDSATSEKRKTALL